MERDLEFYLGQQYSVLLHPISEEDGGGWLAEIPELPGCMSDGETQEEALKNVEEAKKAWIKVAIRRGMEIPPPRDAKEEFSGRLTLRMPKTFHKRLASAAEKEGISLNQFILNLLSLGYGTLYGRPLGKAPVPWEGRLSEMVIFKFSERAKSSSQLGIGSQIGGLWRGSRDKYAEV